MDKEQYRRKGGEKEEKKKMGTPHFPAENVAIVGEKQQVECLGKLQHV